MPPAEHVPELPPAAEQRAPAGVPRAATQPLEEQPSKGVPRVSTSDAISRGSATGIGAASSSSSSSSSSSAPRSKDGGGEGGVAGRMPKTVAS